jgi:hypothetical protein
MKPKHCRGRIPALIACRLRILVSVALCSCNGSGLRTLAAHDGGGTVGSGGVIATGGSSPNAGGGGSGGGSSTQGSTSIRTLGANQCRGNGDCSDIHDTCVPPGGRTPCGVCLWVTSPCTSDSDCQGDGASSICEFAVGCVCPIGTKVSSPGCSNFSDCGTGEACIGRHCVPAACQNNADCPTDFECTGGSCGRKTCSTDADCTGFCVTGACYSRPGTCYGAVAWSRKRTTASPRQCLHTTGASGNSR